MVNMESCTLWREKMNIIHLSNILQIYTVLIIRIPVEKPNLTGHHSVEMPNLLFDETEKNSLKESDDIHITIRDFGILSK